MYSTCQHCICKECYQRAGTNNKKCQYCNKTDGKYSESRELTDAACSNQQLPSEALITFNAETIKAQTYQISMRSEDTVRAFAKKFMDDYQIDLVSIAVDGELYRVDKDGWKILKDVGIKAQTLVKINIRNQGCPK